MGVRRAGLPSGVGMDGLGVRMEADSGREGAGKGSGGRRVMDGWPASFFEAGSMRKSAAAEGHAGQIRRLHCHSR